MTNRILGMFRYGLRPALHTPKIRCYTTLGHTTSFRQGAEHVKGEQALCGRRVEGFRQAAETDVSKPQGLDSLNELLHGWRETVELPHNNDDARASEVERRHEFGADP